MSEYIDDGENAISRTKRVNRRALLYGLYDKEASDKVHEKRSLKENQFAFKRHIEELSSSIRDAEHLINLYEESPEKYPNIDVDAQRERVTKLKDRIEVANKHVEKLQEAREDFSRVITSAPIVRQVQREDRKRDRKSKKKQTEAHKLNSDNTADTRRRLNELRNPEISRKKK